MLKLRGHKVIPVMSHKFDLLSSLQFKEWFKDVLIVNKILLDGLSLVL